MIRSFKPALALILCAVTISYAGDWNVGVGGNTARNCQFDAFGPADAELLWSGGNYAQYSSQAVIEGDYVLMHRRENPDDTFHGTPLLAYDLHTGEELWSTELPEWTGLCLQIGRLQQSCKDVCSGYHRWIHYLGFG